jgi:hypothetical protein
LIDRYRKDAKDAKKFISFAGLPRKAKDLFPLRSLRLCGEKNMIQGDEL